MLPAFDAGSVQFYLRSLGVGCPVLPQVDSSWEGISPQALVAVLGCLRAALLAKGNVSSISNPAKMVTLYGRPVGNGRAEE